MTSPVRNLNPRAAALLPAAAALALVVSGCGALGGGADDAKRDASSGEVTESAAASVFSLEVGDCIAIPDADQMLVEQLDAMPCDQPHDAEIYAEQTLAKLPEEADLETLAGTFCLAEFEPFVGLAYEESVLEVTYLYPTEDSWAQGDDVLQCVVVHPSEDVTATLRGSAV